VWAAETVDEACARPPEFGLAANWGQSTAQFSVNLPRYAATVRVDAAKLPRARAVGWYSRVEQEVTLEMFFDDEHSAREYALSFGPQLEVLEPPELREQVIRVAEGILVRSARAHQP
jgi:predicted DNA-binding transcriptional regulator YafY